jgi:tRNA-specific 2-thiouridylase
MPSPKPKVLVAMSGGVDSSVAAGLLQREGYEVVGCFMRLGSPGDSFDELEPMPDAECDATKIRIGHQGCCSINDAADARLVAAKLGIPLYVCNFKKDFGRIIDYFVDEYNAGRTPNPCVRCNDWLKFGKLHEYARQIGAQYVASGHYARIERDATGAARLLRGVDRAKDQSYVLFGAPPERLEEMLLPIGEYGKSRVREIAAELDLPVFDKPDSQEICFVPDDDYAGLVKRRTPEAVAPGRIVDTDGNALGEHEGHQHFTIGQRRGIRVALGHPIYVLNKDARTNTITVGEKADLQAHGCRADQANWFIEPTADWTPCTAKIRYNAEPVPARVRAAKSAKKGSGVFSSAGELEVRFDESQFAVAPGQAVVCYDGEAVMCGGWINAARL